MTKISRIQAIYDLCRAVFAPPLIANSSISKIRSLLDDITPADVGLEEDQPEDDRGFGFFGKSIPGIHNCRTARWSTPITYLDIFDCENFTIGIFCLPASSTIPLHDHPGMTVLSKILYGSLHVKAYDWVDPAYSQRINGSDGFPARLAKLKMDTVLIAPCPTTVLYPNDGGNIHCFTAVTSCAVLDVLAPPYSEAAGRTCTYYHDYPYSSLMDGSKDFEPEGSYAWLKAIEPPADFFTCPRKYKGPVVHGEL